MLSDAARDELIVLAAEVQHENLLMIVPVSYTHLAQYENGSRTPKADVTAALAKVLDVSPKALDVPDIDSLSLIHISAETGIKSESNLKPRTS